MLPRGILEKTNKQIKQKTNYCWIYIQFSINSLVNSNRLFLPVYDSKETPYSMET